MDNLTNAIENGECVIRIFPDFSKAFGTVNHDILLEEMEHYRIRAALYRGSGFIIPIAHSTLLILVPHLWGVKP